MFKKWRKKGNDNNNKEVITNDNFKDKKYYKCSKWATCTWSSIAPRKEMKMVRTVVEKINLIKDVTDVINEDIMANQQNLMIHANIKISKDNEEQIFKLQMLDFKL